MVGDTVVGDTVVGDTVVGDTVVGDTGGRRHGWSVRRGVTAPGEGRAETASPGLASGGIGAAGDLAEKG